MKMDFFQALINGFQSIVENKENFPIVAKDRKHLDKLIEKYIKHNGYNCDLNHIDVSNITDMSYLFSESWFNGDISSWNVSKVENMEMMFHVSKFNGDISKWNVSSVKSMEKMFRYSIFNKSLKEWKPYSLENKKDMFMGSYLYSSIPYWFSYDNKEIRNKQIDIYHLKNELNQELIINPGVKNKKIKI
jgi:hypothetical protein